MPVLTSSFFQRPVLDVAPDLLGKMLCRQLPDGQILRLPINEVEAYDGMEDKACHAHRGKTDRNAIMFEPGGNWYVYLCYGIHWLLNATTGDAEYPSAVLIRGVGEYDGPGKLTKQLSIDASLKNKAIHPESGLWLEDVGQIVPPNQIQRTPRIGVDYAKEWAEVLYRFVWDA